MERTKKNTDEAIQWHKLGGGSSRLKIGGKMRIIKPGQKFTARPSEVPEAFRDIIVPLETLPETPDPEPVKTEYEVRKRETSSWYDVFGPDGKQVNEKALTREGALKLVKQLV